MIDYWELLEIESSQRSLINKKIMSNIFTINWKDLLSAAISAVVVSILTLIGNSTNIFALDFHQMLSAVVLAFFASILKSLTTDSTGKLGGIFQIK